MKKYVNILLLLLFLFGCKKEEKKEPVSHVSIANSEVIILNEGNFQWGQGTVSLYDPQSGEVNNDVFQSNNNNRPLGDVAQSMTMIGDTGYIVVNNSNKIEVVDLTTFQSIGEISTLNSPRNLLPISPNKAYVSDLYEDDIYIVNPHDFSVIGRINSAGWTEEMVMVNGKVFVCQVDSSQLLVIDAATDQIIDRLPTAHSPQYIELDKNGNVWVSCSGNQDAKKPALQQFNSSNLQLMKSLSEESVNQFFGEIAFNSTKEELFFINKDGVGKLTITDTMLAEMAFVPANNRILYAMNVDPKTNEIYLADAIDYQQRGIIYRYSENGSLMSYFRVGIIPGSIYFKE